MKITRNFLLGFLLLTGTTGMAQDLVIKGATLYASPDDGPVNNAIVIIKNGKISQVGRAGKIALPANVNVIDAKGMYMTAGFWNSHVHLTEVKWRGADTASASRLTFQLNDMLNSRGFTQVFDLAELDVQNLKNLRSRIDRGEVPGPAIRFVGIPLAPENGSPVYIRPYKLPEVGTPSEAITDVTNQIKAGAQGIKLWTGSPDGQKVVFMRADVAKAAVNTAHHYGVPVFAHPGSAEGVNVAIEAGVDILAHVSPDDHLNWPQSIVNAMLQKHMALIPTLKMFQWSLLINNQDTTNNILVTTAIQQLNAFSTAGGRVLFGTDVGYMSDYSTKAEFQLMSRAGMSFKAILASLTTNPAAEFKQEATVGKIAPGMDADVVLLADDPAQNSGNFASVVYTIRKGKIIYHRDKK